MSTTRLDLHELTVTDEQLDLLINATREYALVLERLADRSAARGGNSDTPRRRAEDYREMNATLRRIRSTS